MAKQKNNYFELIKKQTGYCVKAARLLEKILSSFEEGKADTYRQEMHAIEHEADGVHHDILQKLYVEFITPIDQEDILHLVQIIDDITDSLDEVVMDIYMYHIEKLPPNIVQFSQIVSRCVLALDEAAGELENFKKPKALHGLLIKVNDIEIESDEFSTDAIYHLFGTEENPKRLISYKAIYDGMENCCDLCEHAADIIEQVIIKNT